MNGDTFFLLRHQKSVMIKICCPFETPIELRGKLLTGVNVLRIFLLLLEDFSAPLQKGCRQLSHSEC